MSASRERTPEEQQFEEMFGVKLPDDYHIGIYITNLADHPDDPAIREKPSGLNVAFQHDHCGSQTSSTLSVEFFVAIGEELWSDALALA